MKYSIRLSIIALLAFAITACSDKDDEVDIPVSAVPADIISIVQNALPGLVLHEAEKETRDDMIIYELEGNLISGEKYEIKITSSGTLMKIKLEDD